MNFAITFATAGLASVASSGLKVLGAAANTQAISQFANSLGGQMAFGGLVGGVTSAALGGNFWEGLATGAVVSGLNHGLHKLADGNGKNPSLDDAIENYKKGGGDMNVDASKVDLSDINLKEFHYSKKAGGLIARPNLFFRNSSNGSIYGNLTLKWHGGNKVGIYNDKYDWNMHEPYFAPKNTLRNVNTGVGRIYVGSGTEFNFNFQNEGTINVFSPSQSHPFRTGAVEIIVCNDYYKKKSFDLLIFCVATPSTSTSTSLR